MDNVSNTDAFGQYVFGGFIIPPTETLADALIAVSTAQKAMMDARSVYDQSITTYNNAVTVLLNIVNAPKV